jgi:hypothetical protein
MTHAGDDPCVCMWARCAGRAVLWCEHAAGLCVRMHAAWALGEQQTQHMQQRDMRTQETGCISRH